MPAKQLECNYNGFTPSLEVLRRQQSHSDVQLLAAEISKIDMNVFKSVLIKKSSLNWT